MVRRGEKPIERGGIFEVELVPTTIRSVESDRRQVGVQVWLDDHDAETPWAAGDALALAHCLRALAHKDMPFSIFHAGR